MPIKDKISRSAVRVIADLQKRGYEAYIVGGAVRDIMLEKEPKDYDIATDASPEQVKDVFKRRCRIIGRRFKLAHVYISGTLYEVSTFRRKPSMDERKGRDEDSGLIVWRDNEYGNLEEDAFRRDFTVNAIYYDPLNNEQHFVDHVGGIDDMGNGIVRTIGDADERIQEDPVRMLRAVRFCAKLDFTLEQQTGAAISENAHLLDKIPAARLFDESLKLFISGQGEATYAQLEKYDLSQYLIANHKLFSDDEIWQRLLQLALRNTDKRLASGKSITPAFLYAVFLWPGLKEQMAMLEAEGMPPTAALHAAANQVIAAQTFKTSIPKRFQVTMKEIWEMQLRLPRNQGNRALKLIA
ncbi:MAG: polynucleotide adenylyltransferase PcnB, partial [Lentisphaeria bacterium]|nr:polynucleotide adenylyltransferase PcnB [Lentisphaeria bacterium]NQZ69977.1 polynucleotide adenylyltransferase PcnB [Lentisphaeria bacterium]